MLAHLILYAVKLFFLGLFISLIKWKVVFILELWYECVISCYVHFDFLVFFTGSVIVLSIFLPLWQPFKNWFDSYMLGWCSVHTIYNVQCTYGIICIPFGVWFCINIIIIIIIKWQYSCETCIERISSKYATIEFCFFTILNTYNQHLLLVQELHNIVAFNWIRITIFFVHLKSR